MQILITRTEEDIELAYKRLLPAGVLGCDTETGGLNPKTAGLYSVQFSDGEVNVLVPVSEGIGLGRLETLLEDSTITKIFHNAKFDLGFLSENGYHTENVFDTMIAERILTSGANQSVSLAETLYRYFAIDLDKSQRRKFGRNWDKIWTKELVEYALSDVAFLPKLMEEQTRWMMRLDLTGEYEAKMESVLGRDMPGEGRLNSLPRRQR